MNMINVDGKMYDILEQREYGQSVRDQRKEILFHDPSESKFYLLLSFMEGSANTAPVTRLLTEKITISELTEEQVNSWKNRNLDLEKLPHLEVNKEIIIS